MIEVFTGWVKDIIFVVLFASFLELLLPSSNMQRFVRVIMGLFIMIAILNPIIDIVQNHEALANQLPVLNSNSVNSAVIMNRANSVSIEREKISIELYKKELAQQIKIVVLAIDGVADVNVVVETNPENNDLTGVIKNVALYISPDVPKIGNIPKVSIGGAHGNREAPQKELQIKITQMITELFQIPKEKIEIRMLYS
jgi:stage III sporulation protein AF